jgi:peptide deformylase
MAVRSIRKLPDPILRSKAKRVRFIDNSVQKLIDDMVDTMHEASGVGLAANQVGVLLRIAVIHEPEQDLLVLINPEMVRRSEEEEMEEACLSVPGYKGLVQRSVAVVVKGLNRKGKEIRIKADGLLAHALQHELDHLNGILYIDRVASKDKLQKVEPQSQFEESSISEEL